MVRFQKLFSREGRLLREASFFGEILAGSYPIFIQEARSNSRRRRLRRYFGVCDLPSYDKFEAITLSRDGQLPPRSLPKGR